MQIFVPSANASATFFKLASASVEIFGNSHSWFPMNLRAIDQHTMSIAKNNSLMQLS